MLEEAAETVLQKGNERHRKTVKNLLASETEIRLVPLDQIGCSGVAGLIDRRRTNRKIDNEIITETEAMGEAHITFSDWTFDVAGSRGVEGTLVHEGLHICDFGEIISSFSKADHEPLNIYDLSLYELEHRAAVTSGEYLALIGREDYVNEGLQLGIVKINDNGEPEADLAGIDDRMQNGYGVNINEQGIMISKMLGIRPKGSSFGFLSMLGF